MCIAAGIIGGAAVGAVGSVVAGNEQKQGAEAAANTQMNMFNRIQANEQPFIQGGQSALGTLNDMLKPGGYLTEQFNPTQAQLDQYPGYQFALKTGGQAIRNADTPGVGALSGAALKDLTNFNVGTANQYYGQYFNQFQTQQNNIFNRLNTIANMGQNAAGNLGTAGTQLGPGIAQAQAAAGGSIAGGIAGATNNIGNAVSLAALANGQGSNPYVTPQGTIAGGGGNTTDAGGGYTFSY